MTANKKAAQLATGTASSVTSDNNIHYINKIDRIRIHLEAPAGLNRFEAERIGDHVLNSTIAALRKRGEDIREEWEVVPTRYCACGVRVKRYWIVREVN